MNKKVLKTHLSEKMKVSKMTKDISKNCNKCGSFINKKGKAYITPALTVDSAVVRNHGKDQQVLLIKRKNHPFAGCLAFPGGFVDYGEDPKNACKRELEEETTLKGENPILINVYGNPSRDPRKHIISLFYYIEEKDDEKEPKGKDDAVEATFYPIHELTENKDKFAFDHFALLQDLISFLEKNTT